MILLLVHSAELCVRHGQDMYILNCNAILKRPYIAVEGPLKFKLDLSSIEREMLSTSRRLNFLNRKTSLHPDWLHFKNALIMEHPVCCAVFDDSRT